MFVGNKLSFGISNSSLTAEMSLWLQFYVYRHLGEQRKEISKLYSFPTSDKIRTCHVMVDRRNRIQP